MIEVRGLSKSYGVFEAVKDVSFSASDGCVIGLLGPNGAGKTTIMKVLTGFHRPSSGRALVGGVDVAEDPLAVKRLVGYLPEGVPLYGDMTVWEYLCFIAEARGLNPDERAPAAVKAMEACGLDGMGPVLIEHLSKGFRQRVGLAQAILHDPPVLVLDEPTTGLDPNQILEIRSLIRSLGGDKTVILSTHIMQEVEALCSEVLILNEGRIAAQGSARELSEAMQGGELIKAVILARGGGDDGGELGAGAAASALGWADAAARPLGGGRSELSYRAPAGRGDEAAERLFDWAAASGAKLLELRRERISLEEIFVRLTSEEHNE
jgi:ABC-2 type transport system ATP-binding protein